MTRERIEDMREVVLPFVKKRLLETNYEGLGESDAKEFERDFNEILNLAIKALEQEPRKGHWIYKEFDERTGITNVHICSKCGCPLASPYKSFCSACGSDNREVKE